jgi:hypothetical protein
MRTGTDQPRALSAYMFFVQDWRERIKSENADASFGDIGKLLGAKWKEMDASEKKVGLLFGDRKSESRSLTFELLQLTFQPYDEAAKRDKERVSALHLSLEPPRFSHFCPISR